MLDRLGKAESRLGEALYADGKDGSRGSENGGEKRRSEEEDRKEMAGRNEERAGDAESKAERNALVE